MFADEYNTPTVMPIVCLPPPADQRANYTIIQNGYKCAGDQASQDDYDSDSDEDVFDKKLNGVDDTRVTNFIGNILSSVCMAHDNLVNKWLKPTHRHSVIKTGDDPLYSTYDCRPREYRVCSYATGLVYMKFEHKTDDALNFIVCIRAYNHDT
jgi:hypothetical protein